MPVKVLIKEVDGKESIVRFKTLQAAKNVVELMSKDSNIKFASVLEETDVTNIEALRMLACTNMRPFKQDDWSAFAGCESKEPMIGEYHDSDIGHFTLVLDGAILLVIMEGDDGGGQSFELHSNND